VARGALSRTALSHITNMAQYKNLKIDPSGGAEAPDRARRRARRVSGEALGK
jgi:hypothetical protein